MKYFASKLSRRMGKQVRFISEQVMRTLTNSPWAGNVRELANFIERAVILSPRDELQLPMAALPVSYSPSVLAPTCSFQDAERKVIVEAMRAASGRIAGNGGAAERLGLKRTTLQNKMRRLGITKAQYQQ